MLLQLADYVFVMYTVCLVSFSFDLAAVCVLANERIHCIAPSLTVLVHRVTENVGEALLFTCCVFLYLSSKSVRVLIKEKHAEMSYCM